MIERDLETGKQIVPSASGDARVPRPAADRGPRPLVRRPRRGHRGRGGARRAAASTGRWCGSSRMTCRDTSRANSTTRRCASSSAARCISTSTRGVPSCCDTYASGAPGHGGRRSPTCCATACATACSRRTSIATGSSSSARTTCARRSRPAARAGLSRIGGGHVRLNRLRLLNFRQHADTEIEFDSGTHRHHRAERRGKVDDPRGHRVGALRRRHGARREGLDPLPRAPRRARRCASSSTSSSAGIATASCAASRWPSSTSTAESSRSPTPPRPWASCCSVGWACRGRSSSTPTSPARRSWR